MPPFRGRPFSAWSIMIAAPQENERNPRIAITKKGGFYAHKRKTMKNRRGQRISLIVCYHKKIALSILFITKAQHIQSRFSHK
jgi:hypothetical protein